MATKNPRINVTFEATTVDMLSALAHQGHQSVSGLVRELALEALEMREDAYLASIAEKTDTPEAKTYNHREAWM
jgi:hypothetical protein